MFNHIPLNPTEALSGSIKDDSSPSGRFYEFPGGIRLPSVTNVLGQKDKEFWIEWAKEPRNAAKAERGRNRGTEMHRCIEMFLKNEEMGKGYQGIHFEAIKPVLLKHINNIRCQEFPIYSKLLGLAGTIDCVAEWDQKISILDFKTASREKSKEEILSYFQQCCCYSIMVQEHFGLDIRQIVVVIANDDGGVQIFIENPLNYCKSLFELLQNTK